MKNYVMLLFQIRAFAGPRQLQREFHEQRVPTHDGLSPQHPLRRESFVHEQHILSRVGVKCILPRVSSTHLLVLLVVEAMVLVVMVVVATFVVAMVAGEVVI